ncbi:L-seryl-tRNA(Sec) selenium transferase [Caldanaerobacter sp.]|uniref:L-seryl-tRNA(Sec) selenium transferase n=1 Tax=Caldanaerobacter sp. TaxID=2930036 RepID=UPI003C757CDA
MEDLYKELPSVDEILREGKISEFLKFNKREVVKNCIREVLERYREKIRRGEVKKIDIEKILEDVVNHIEEKKKMSLRRVVNGTGIILHTNLGRALFPPQVKEHLLDIAFRYSTLEYDVEKGERGSRYSHVENLLCELLDVEAALVVNNNAAAVLLALNTLAKGKEVIVSRGQLIEIGGSFRIPDVMLQSGAILKEVGTTNKTYDFDYINAITENTALLLKVHTSNYRIVGFTHDIATEELVQIGRKYDIPTMEDLGSGVMVDLREYGLPHEPTVQEVIKAGVDIVTFSGDKLLGGPQAGIIVGKKKYIDLMKKNPLTRALRVDKLCLVSLESVLRIYRDYDPVEAIPTLKMLTAKASQLYKKAAILNKLVLTIPKVKSRVVEIASLSGGGSLPEESLPSYGVTLEMEGFDAEDLEKRLRIRDIPIITRIVDGVVTIDVRTLLEGDEEVILRALKEIAEVCQ